MTRSRLAPSPALSLLLALSLAAPLSAQEPAAQAPPVEAPSPNAIVAQADASEWRAIAAEDLLVMTLAPDRDGGLREVVLQLMPAPFSQGWVENVRTLARAGWYDGITINRVQDNYVVQWGDPNYDNPEAEGEAKPLPEGLRVIEESKYVSKGGIESLLVLQRPSENTVFRYHPDLDSVDGQSWGGDAYALNIGFSNGWPIGIDDGIYWPIHCYGMVGVGRGMSPDTGSGAELYTVIGHAPRHLDRNIALVGRVIAGMEHLSSLPRGSGELGFYTAEEADKRTPIVSVRLASDLPASARAQYEYLATDGATFARYAEARANRRDPFFIVPAGGTDICNIPVPVRKVAAD